MELNVLNNGNYYELKKTADSRFLKIGSYNSQFVWLDGQAGGCIDWTFTANGDGTYKVSMAQDIVARDGGVAAGTYYLTGANATTTESDAHNYALVSKADYLNIPQVVPSTSFDMSRVAITNTSNGNWNGDHLDWMDVGSIATYKISASEASDYRLSFKASSCKSNGAIVKVDIINSDNSTAFSGNINVANSGTWDNFVDYYAYIPSLPAGDYSLVLTFNAEAKSVDNIEGTCNMKALALEKPEAVTLNESDETAPEAKNIVNVTLNRSLKADRWNTFCVPFDMAKPDGWIVKVLTNASDNLLTFSDAESIEAGKPYMVKPAEDVTTVSANGVNIIPTVNTDNAISLGDYTMTGNFTTMYVPEGAYFINNNIFYLADQANNVSLKGYRAYITVTSSAQAAKSLAMNIDGQVTGITNINADANTSMEIKAMYNLAGQKVGNNYKGIVIKNGKKYFNK